MTTIHDVVRYHITEAKRCREHIERNGDRCPRAAYEEIATFHDECAAVLHDHLAKGAHVPDAKLIELANTLEKFVPSGGPGPLWCAGASFAYNDVAKTIRAMLSQRGEVEGG